MNPSTQFGLRASIRNSSGYNSSGLSFNNGNQYGGSQYSNGSSLNDSIKGSSPMVSPKPGQANDDNRNYLMKKKSPLKVEEINGNNNSLSYGGNYTKNEHYAKNDRNNRL